MTTQQWQQLSIKGLPHSVETEESIIGCVLIDGGLFPLVNLKPGHFFIHRFRFIWQAFCNLHKKGMAIDMLTIVEELNSVGQLQEIGGPAEITRLVNSVPSTLNWQSYETIIRGKYQRRKQLEAANFIAHGAHNGGADVPAAIDMLAETSALDNTGRMINEGISDLYDETHRRISNPKDIWGIPTGFLDFDRLLGGLQYQQNNIVCGDAGVGKTTLVLQVGLNVALGGKSVAIFEAEMDEARMLRRLVEIYTKGKVTNRMMLTGNVPEKVMSEMVQAFDVISALPIFVNDSPSISTAEIRAVVTRLQTKQKIDVLILDMLDLLEDSVGRDHNINTAIKAKRFRQVCRQTNTAGLSIQDMTKDGMQQVVKKLHHMAGSAKVAHSADNVFFLQKNPDQHKAYDLVGAKIRDGDMIYNKIQLVRPGLHFETPAHKSDMQTMPDYFHE